MAQSSLNARVRTRRHKWSWALAVFLISEAVQIGGAPNYKISRALFVIVAGLVFWEIAPAVSHLQGWKHKVALLAVALAGVTVSAWKSQGAYAQKNRSPQ
jgi:hypothetical protein